MHLSAPAARAGSCWIPEHPGTRGEHQKLAADTRGLSRAHPHSISGSAFCQTDVSHTRCVSLAGSRWAQWPTQHADRDASLPRGAGVLPDTAPFSPFFLHFPMSTHSCSSISPEAFCCQSSDNLSRKLCVLVGLLGPSTTLRWGKKIKKKEDKEAAGGGSARSSFSMQLHSLRGKIHLASLKSVFPQKKCKPTDSAPTRLCGQEGERGGQRGARPGHPRALQPLGTTSSGRGWALQVGQPFPAQS